MKLPLRSQKNITGINNIFYNIQNTVDSHDATIEDLPQMIDTKIDAKLQSNDAQIKDLMAKMARPENQIATLHAYQDDLKERVEHNMARIESSEKSERLDTVIIEGHILDKEKSLKSNVYAEMMECIRFQS